MQAVRIEPVPAVLPQPLLCNHITAVSKSFVGSVVFLKQILQFLRKCEGSLQAVTSDTASSCLTTYSDTNRMATTTSTMKQMTRIVMQTALVVLLGTKAAFILPSAALRWATASTAMAARKSSRKPAQAAKKQRMEERCSWQLRESSSQSKMRTWLTRQLNSASQISQLARALALLSTFRLIHSARHRTCAYFTDPVHLQGAITLPSSSPSRQMRHSLVRLPRWRSLAGSWDGGCSAKRTGMTQMWEESMFSGMFYNEWKSELVVRHNQLYVRGGGVEQRVHATHPQAVQHLHVRDLQAQPLRTQLPRRHPPAEAHLQVQPHEGVRPPHARRPAAQGVRAEQVPRLHPPRTRRRLLRGPRPLRPRHPRTQPPRAARQVRLAALRGRDDRRLRLPVLRLAGALQQERLRALPRQVPPAGHRERLRGLRDFAVMSEPLARRVINYIAMETPQKGSYKRRLQTTAASDRNDTRLFTLEDERKGRLSTEIVVGTTKKKLYFASEQEQRCKRMSQQQPQIERSYRQKMLNYLNAKFATALAKASTNSIPQEKPSSNKARQDCRLKERIASAFHQFMQSARAQNMSETISEFQVGCLLKDMHFIRSLLEQRSLVLRVCRQLKAMRVECLFMFVLHLHVLHSERQIDQSRKQEIVEQVRGLLEDEGIAASTSQLRQCYESQEGSGRGEERQAMRARRAGRQTESSLGRSLSRGKE